MALGVRLGCWAICSGRPSVKVRGRFARLHRTPARVESEWERELITLRSLCHPCGKTRIWVRATRGARNAESPPLTASGESSVFLWVRVEKLGLEGCFCEFLRRRSWSAGRSSRDLPGEGQE